MVPVLSAHTSAMSSTVSLDRHPSVTSLQNYAYTATPGASGSTSDIAREDDLNHAKGKLDARHYKRPEFTRALLEILRKLHIPGWSAKERAPESVVVHKVSGALTNAVFFVSCPSVPSARTLLLRIYGSSSGSLISRPRELHVLHVLSSRYKIGPRVYGTFENGRVEEYFDSVTLTAADIRQPEISAWIGARMAELHSVDIGTVEGPNWRPDNDVHGWEIAANVKSWFGPAKAVFDLPVVSDDVRKQIDLDRFKLEWTRYVDWMVNQKHTYGQRRVFCHNDAQYGNLLRLKDSSQGLDEHRQIIVVDFEYAAPNAAAYDIVNHFHEWTANYHGPTPHLLDPKLYPTPEERRNFYAAYILHAAMLADDPLTGSLSAPELAALVEELERDVVIWSPASHAGWAIWGIVQAREDLENGNTEPDFDYVGYALGRIAAFRQDLVRLGL